VARTSHAQPKPTTEVPTAIVISMGNGRGRTRENEVESLGTWWKKRKDQKRGGRRGRKPTALRSFLINSLPGLLTWSEPPKGHNKCLNFSTREAYPCNEQKYK